MQAVVDSNSPPWAIHRSEVVGRGRLSHAESVILVVMMTVVFDLVLHGPPAISRPRLERTDRCGDADPLGAVGMPHRSKGGPWPGRRASADGLWRGVGRSRRERRPGHRLARPCPCAMGSRDVDNLYRKEIERHD